MNPTSHLSLEESSPSPRASRKLTIDSLPSVPRERPIRNLWIWSAFFLGVVGSLYIAVAPVLPDFFSSLKEFIEQYYGTVVFTIFLLFFILAVVFYKKIWKVLQPLRKLSLSRKGQPVSPGAAVGLLFVPVANLVWYFLSINSLPYLCSRLSSNYDIAYKGPSTRLATLTAYATLVTGILLILLSIWSLFFSYESYPYVKRTCSILFWFLLPLCLLFNALYLERLNKFLKDIYTSRQITRTA